MKISELIERLEAAKAEHGDIGVAYWFHSGYYTFDIRIEPESDLMKGRFIISNGQQIK